MPDAGLRLAVALAHPVLGASASPSPSPSAETASAPKGLDPDKVTPGLEGFLAILALAILTVLLIRSMVRRIRRIRFRAQRSGELETAPLPVAHPRPARGLGAARPRALPEDRAQGPAAPRGPGAAAPDEGDEPPRTR